MLYVVHPTKTLQEPDLLEKKNKKTLIFLCNADFREYLSSLHMTNEYQTVH